MRAISSPPLVRELRSVLRERFGRSAVECDEITSFLLAIAELVPGEAEVEVAVRDPDDARVLACALEGEAAAIVTGDKDLLVLQAVGTVRILTARQALEAIGER